MEILIREACKVSIVGSWYRLTRARRARDESLRQCEISGDGHVSSKLEFVFDQLLFVHSVTNVVGMIRLATKFVQRIKSYCDCFCKHEQFCLNRIVSKQAISIP